MYCIYTSPKSKDYTRKKRPIPKMKLQVLFIGYRTKTVGRIERGDSTPSAEFMLRISKYFNMLVEYVFHVED